MPAFANILKPAEIDDVVAFLQSRRIGASPAMRADGR